tara:strand:+ start:22 stop:426 length:405 start_codon:yes stop_codon:yes gene_type:complete
MKCFVDSSFFVSLSKENDKNHYKALEIAIEAKDKKIVFYTSDRIIDETATVLSMKASKVIAVNFLDYIEKDEDSPMVLGEDNNTRGKARRLFRLRKEKDISIIDCHSAVLMKKQRIRKCFTFDKHFKKLGFEIL